MATDRKFLINIGFQEINFEPITPKAILHKKAKKTDLISNVNAGGNLHLLVSIKFCEIIKKFRKSGVQFFYSSLLTSMNIEIADYFSMNMFIDIKKSIIKHYRKSDDYELSYKTNVEMKSFVTYESFTQALQVANQKNETFYIDKIRLIDNVSEDFFMLRHVEGGVKYVVSEKFKKEVEDAACTGIEFQPSELSLAEWLQGGERAKVYGKT